MDPKHPIVFLLEDCPDTAVIIERAVMTEMPEVRLLWARNVAEATARVQGLRINLFLVDITLPDGNGLDFLWQMTTAHPGARAIVITASPRLEHRLHTQALGALHFLEKPFLIQTLIDQLRAALGTATTEVEERCDFRATLENVTPADILQLKCLTGATTIVEFLSDQQIGRIRFEDGQITDASTDELRGVDALYEIIGWKRGQVTEHPCVGFFERTIHSSWQNLLMDAAHRLDERVAVGAA
jgi:DNA-binding response OmpR family regulator